MLRVTSLTKKYTNVPVIKLNFDGILLEKVKKEEDSSKLKEPRTLSKNLLKRSLVKRKFS